MTRRHVVITGTGRTGTSFLVELLTHLGLDTGFAPEDLARHKSAMARAGFEHDIRSADAPFIVKSPWFCDYCDEILCRDDIAIDHVYIPMRDSTAAAESRRYVSQQTIAAFPIWKRMRFLLSNQSVAGGFWHAKRGGQQEEVLLGQVYKLVLALSRTMVPVTLLQYPLIVNDPMYLFEKLLPVLGSTTFHEFESTHSRVARKDLVHSFSPNDR